MDYTYYAKGAESYMGKSVLCFFIGLIFAMIGSIMLFWQISFWITSTLVIDWKFGGAFMLSGLGLILIVMNIENKLRLPIRNFNKVKGKIGNHIESDNMLWEITMGSGGDIDLKQPICPKPECLNSIFITYHSDGVQTLHTCSGCNNQWKGKTFEIEKSLAMTKLNKKRRELNLYEPDRIIL